MQIIHPIPFVFFGTPDIAVFVLEELERGGLPPSLVVTAPDRPVGRGLRLTPPPVKTWAEAHGIPVLQPEKLDASFIEELAAQNSRLETQNLFAVVAAYGKIIPARVLELFPRGMLNVHPSLLPRYRGPSPIEAPLLAGDTKTGITIMLLDAEMDHGPLIRQREVDIGDIPNARALGEHLAREGGRMLADMIPAWSGGMLAPKEQDHASATYTKKIKKEDGLIDLADSGETNYRKFQAYIGWPGTYFFDKNNKRIKITDASLEDGMFVIKKVIPEGKKEVPYTTYIANM